MSGLKILGVESGGYTQLNPKGTVYLQDLRSAKWWGTAWSREVHFRSNSSDFSLHDPDPSGKGSRWTAYYLPYLNGEKGWLGKRYSGKWDLEVSGFKKPIRMTMIQDNKPPTSRAYIDSLIDDDLKTIKLNSQINDFTPTLRGHLSSKLDKDSRIEIKSTYMDNGKKREEILGHATTNNLNWSFTPSKSIPSGSNLKQDISARVIDRAGNGTKKDSISIIVNDLPEAKALITSISGKSTKGKTQLYTNASKPTISGKITSALKDDERIEIWTQHKRFKFSKFSKSKRLGFAQVDNKDWNFIPKKGLKTERWGSNIHLITARVINEQGKYSAIDEVNFILDIEAPNILMRNIEEVIKEGWDEILNEPFLARLKRISRVTEPGAKFIEVSIDKEYHKFIKKSNINVTNGSIAKIFSIPGDRYSRESRLLFIAVLPAKDSAGNVVLKINQGVIKDDAGNISKASKISIPFDTRTKDVTPKDGVLEPIVDDLNPIPEDSNNPVDPSKPSLKTSEVEIAEDAKPGTTIIDLADTNSGKDLDADGDKLTYSIKTGNDDGLFSIDPDSGVITIATGKSLNYDTKATYELKVEASDGSESDSALITIKVNDVSGYPIPVDTSPSLEDKTIQVNESIKPGDVIVDLSDESGGDTNSNGDALVYSISSGNDEKLFEINSSNGKISLSEERVPAAKFFDFETKNTFTIGVKASADSKTDTAQITVQIQDQDEKFNLGTPVAYSWGGNDITGNINDSAISNWISLPLDKGRRVSLGFNGSGTLDSQSNVYVKAIYNDFGHLVEENTYFKEFNLTSYDITPPYSGTYYVEVKARDGESGSYGFGTTANDGAGAHTGIPGS